MALIKSSRRGSELDSSWSGSGSGSHMTSNVSLSKKGEEQWMEWRGIQDRVTEWIKKSAGADVDNSHINAMLEPENKRGVF